MKNRLSRIGFIAVAAGSAVGMGNIWRFPYEAGSNGGAAFVLVYLLATLCICLPVLIAEIYTGVFTKLKTYGAYKKLGGKKWSLIGLFNIISGFLLLSFYNVVSAWSLGYFGNFALGNIDSSVDTGAFFGNFTVNFPLQLGLTAFFMLLTIIIVWFGVKQGLERFSKFAMPTLIVLLVGMVIYALTLDGAAAGLKFYLIPDFSKITAKVIYSAVGQAFFSLSLGMGTLITMGSYLEQKEDLVKTSIFIILTDISIALLAGLLIFPLVFTFGIDPSAGPGLVFVVLPNIFANMGGIVGQVLGAMFFLLIAFAALTSTISFLEVLTAYFIEEWKMSRKKVVGIVGFIVWFIGIGTILSFNSESFFSSFLTYGGETKNFMDFLNDVFANLGLPFGGLMICLLVRFKINKKDFLTRLNHKLAPVIWILITIICPIILTVIFTGNLLESFF